MSESRKDLSHSKTEKTVSRLKAKYIKKFLSKGKDDRMEQMRRLRVGEVTANTIARELMQKEIGMDMDLDLHRIDQHQHHHFSHSLSSAPSLGLFSDDTASNQHYHHHFHHLSGSLFEGGSAFTGCDSGGGMEDGLVEGMSMERFDEEEGEDMDDGVEVGSKDLLRLIEDALAHELELVLLNSEIEAHDETSWLQILEEESNWQDEILDDVFDDENTILCPVCKRVSLQLNPKNGVLSCECGVNVDALRFGMTSMDHIRAVLSLAYDHHLTSCEQMQQRVSPLRDIGLGGEYGASKKLGALEFHVVPGGLRASCQRCMFHQSIFC